MGAGGKARHEDAESVSPRLPVELAERRAQSCEPVRGRIHGPGALCRGGPIIAPTTTPTISQSSVCSSIMMAQCSGFSLHGRNSTRSSLGRATVTGRRVEEHSGSGAFACPATGRRRRRPAAARRRTASRPGAPDCRTPAISHLLPAPTVLVAGRAASAWRSVECRRGAVGSHRSGPRRGESRSPRSNQ